MGQVKGNKRASGLLVWIHEILVSKLTKLRFWNLLGLGWVWEECFVTRALQLL